MRPFLGSSVRTPSGGQSPFCGANGRWRDHGLTLVEMLVSMAITLIMLFAIVTIFSWMGKGVNAGRATIELSSQLRQGTNLLQQDLDGLTAATLPWADDDAAPGYFEYIEGPFADTDGAVDPTLAKTYDVDDILIFTSRRKGKPFIATTGAGATKTLLESQAAEIVWFCWPMTPTDQTTKIPVTTRLYRVVVPVRPGVTNLAGNLGRHPGGVDSA